MEFRLPDFQLVVDIHDIVVAEFGGLKGLPHPEHIEAAIKRPENYMSYSENCDIHLVAALILDSLTRYHAFADGNKRTALMSMLFIYNLNGIELKFSLLTNEKFEKLVLEVVKNKPSILIIQNQLKKLIKEFGKV